MKAFFCLLSVAAIILGGCQPNFQMGQPSSTSAPPAESPVNVTNPNPLSTCASLDGLMRKELTNQWLPNRIARFEDGSQLLTLHCHDAMENDFTHQVNFAEGSMLSYVYLKSD